MGETKIGLKEKIKGKNKLIFFLSDYKKDARSEDYEYKPESKKIKGEQTPDAPTKYFINCLKEKGETLDSILCITSFRANGGKDGTQNNYDKNAYKHYERMIETFYKDELKEENRPKLERISFDYDFDENINIQENERYKRLFESIDQHLEKGDDQREPDNIYIDYTSGMRDISFLIILIIRYLENIGIKCEGMIYSYRPPRGSNETGNNKIVDLKSTYDLFELLNGVNEFTSFGKSKALSEYYKKISKKDSLNNANKKSNEEDREINQKDEAVEKINDLIDVMKRFSDVISLCMVQEIDNIMRQLQAGISEVKKVLNPDPNQKQNQKQEKSVIFTLENSMFYNLITQIENKFYIKDGKDITYIDIIRWCLDNDLIQQALTLYVEKIPQYYLDDKHKFYDIEEENLKATINNNNESKDYAHIFYTDIFSNIWYNKLNYPINQVKAEENQDYKNNEKINQIKNIIEKNKHQILSREKIFLENYGENIKKVIDKIYDIMNKIYRENQEVRIVRMKLSRNTQHMPKTEEKFINTFKVDNKLIGNILEEIGQINSIYNMKYLFANKEKEYVLSRKINSIIILRKSDIKPPWLNNKINLNEFVELMEDYVYFKIMRNQINHASSNELKNEVIDYLIFRKYEVDINEKNIKDEIKNIMYRSINSIESIAEKIEDNKEHEYESKHVAITSEA